MVESVGKQCKHFGTVVKQLFVVVGIWQKKKLWFPAMTGKPINESVLVWEHLLVTYIGMKIYLHSKVDRNDVCLQQHHCGG